MKQLVEYIVSNLVNHPEDVAVEEQAVEGGEFTLINIQVNPEDIGRVIGKSGKVIKAIRQITRIAAIQKGVKVRVDLIDQQAPETNQENEIVPEEEVAPEEAKTEEEATPEKEEVKEEKQTEEESKQVYPEPETLEEDGKSEA